MKSVTTQKFWDAFYNLPIKIQKKARDKYDLFAENPRHPSLRFKKVLKPDIYSVRVTQSYRALGVMRKNKIIWFWIGSHDDYEHLLKQMD